VSAGGIGLLAVLAQRRGHAAQWPAVVVAIIGLGLLGVSLAGGAPAGTAVSVGALAIWLAVSGLAAGLFGLRGSGAALGLAAGTLYAAGDVATKAAVHGGAWLLVVPLVLAAHGGAFAGLQLGFQRGTPLATAGTSTLLTNALPIAAGVALFHEHLPHGVLGVVRVAAFASVVVAAAMLARGPSGEDPRGYADEDSAARLSSTTRSATSSTSPAARRNSASYGRPASPT
jgi:hypothetical protein